LEAVELLEIPPEKIEVVAVALELRFRVGLRCIVNPWVTLDVFVLVLVLVALGLSVWGPLPLEDSSSCELVVLMLEFTIESTIPDVFKGLLAFVFKEESCDCDGDVIVAS